jgi:DNA-binding protein HU-beta
LTVFTAHLYHRRRASENHPNYQSLLSKQIETEAGSVIKLDIVNRVADRTGVPKMKAEQAVDALFHSMKDALMRGERIELRGFGVFVVKPRKRGVGRNPRTGEEVAIPSGKTIRFKPGKELQAHEGDAGGQEASQTAPQPPSLPDAEY